MTPPGIGTLDSPTHPDPDTWYSNADPELLWPPGVWSECAVEGLGMTDRITVIGHYAYVCSWNEGLLIYDVFDPSSPMLVSATPAIADRMIDACGDGRYAYVAAGNDGLLVLDVSDKTDAGDRRPDADAVRGQGRRGPRAHLLRG